MQETWVQSLGWTIPWRRKCLPTPVFLPGKSPGERSLAGYNPRGRKSQTMTYRLNHQPPLLTLLKAFGQFTQNLWEMKRTFFRNVFIRVRKRQPLSTEIHLPLVKGHFQRCGFWLWLWLTKQVLLASQKALEHHALIQACMFEVHLGESEFRCHCPLQGRLTLRWATWYVL